MPCVARPQTARVATCAIDRDLSAASEILASINRAAGVGLHSLATAQAFPPAYVCANAAGVPVALDVAGFTRAEAAHDDPMIRVLHAGALAAHLARILAAQDTKAFQGGPYAEVVTVLVIDEPALTLRQAVFELASVAFGPFRQITSAYLVLPYDSSTMSCPAVPIRFSR